MAIIRYKNNIFTHDGQSDVDGFIEEIKGVLSIIRQIENFTVYAGVHGNTNGAFDHNFSEEEWAATNEMANSLRNVTLIELTDNVLSKDEMRRACENGSVFFTWCDSDKTLENYSITLEDREEL
ncbi:hypothetical protein CRV08_08295 [Halarcobacter ebronensis]|uniref:Uncharacterized protein n=1 Tax=Halarcobacter ebronensis TaxID=1462615 RepID=A0A4Q0YDQ9_9BACT|nr:hypothetical protein [Halarcobacter ebronensis]RXJ68243.1 hypothetical protein CRV08_08295 [Halarcobacter ebronensis]